MERLTPEDPRRIGGFRLLNRLGEGGMGLVYLARSDRGRTVAVKVVKSDLASQPDFRSRFAREITAARRVGGAWTAPVLDADPDAETPWVATGYVAGPSLAEVVGDQYGPLPAQSVMGLAAGLAHALRDIHGAGLVHRDLKPSNILITIDGPRVIDFGIARALDATVESSGGLTRTGMVVGSPGFMSPEQVRGVPVTAASDIFCMGTVLAYAATGRMPFGTAGNEVHALMFRIAEEEPDLTGLSGELLGIVSDCLVKNPERRPGLAELVSRTDGALKGTWLPGEVLAELGRHAVQLLDSEDPEVTGEIRISAGALGATQGITAETTAGVTAGTAPPPTLPSEPSTRPDVPAPGGYGPPASGPEAAGVPSAGAPADAVAPPTLAAPGDAPADGLVSLSPGAPETHQAPRRRRNRSLAIGALAVVLVAGAGFAASGAGLLGSDSGNKVSSDVPDDYVGTWIGPVERDGDGDPTGQYRRFVIARGNIGQIVTHIVDLGVTYECRSDGKLASAKDSLTIKARVAKSVPKGKCSKPGTHTLSPGPDSTLRWAAGGRHALLQKVDTPERLPKAFLGTWQRPLSGGGMQQVKVRQLTADRKSIDLILKSAGKQCEAQATVFSVGGGTDPVLIGPSVIDWRTSAGDCPTTNTNMLRVEDGRLIREFPDTGKKFTYDRVG
jgi:eukaryotic-like serine/threonine-protein kinase